MDYGRKKKRNFDEDNMTQEDYLRLQGYQQDWHNATDQAGRDAAHQAAENLRQRYGYASDPGGGFRPIAGQEGVSQQTGLNLLQAQNQQNRQNQMQQNWDRMVEEYLSRPAFSYDLNADPLYQQYAEQYQRLGREAMDDTLGQAAALTGGYDSSYAQGAGQQMYNAYLNQLNDKVPQLRAQARAEYDAEGNRLLQGAQLAGQGAQIENDNRWHNLNYWQQQANTEQGRADQQQQLSAAEQQQAYGNLVTSISNTGYRPSAAELQAAGMTQAEADAWLNYYNRQQALKVSGRGGGGGRRGRGRGRGNGNGGDGDGNSDADDRDRIGDLEAQWLATGNGHYIDDGATQAFMDEHNLHGKDREQFVFYLLNDGVGYSWNAGR